MALALLPHVGLALLLTTVTTAISHRLGANPQVRLAICLVTVIIVLAPFLSFSLTHYVRGLTGDLSMTTWLVFGLVLFENLSERSVMPDAQKRWLCVAVVAIAVMLYPTALGLTRFDLYAWGYYPIFLAPAGLAALLFCLWNSWKLPAAALGLAYGGFTIGMLESNNLWDYLLDPMLVAYCGFQLIRGKSATPISRPRPQHIEQLSVFTVIAFLAFAVLLAKINPESFRYEFTIEDGFIEWTTVLVLLAAMMVCFQRLARLRNHKPARFLAVTALLGGFCLFGAGEEISWGQRIFNFESPAFFLEHNAQQEIGLHNLVIEWRGEEIKINRLVFGTGLAVLMLIYLGVITPLYRTQPGVTRFFDGIGAPMPRNYQIGGYLLVVATVELLIDHGKRGELTEFAGAIIFALNVCFPYNAENFQSPASGDRAQLPG